MEQEIASTDVSQMSCLKLQVLQMNLQNFIIFTGTNVFLHYVSDTFEQPILRP